MTTTRQLPAFTVTALEVCEGDFIVIPSTTPVARPIITRVLNTEQVGDDVIITTTCGEMTTSEGNLLTSLGRMLEVR